MNRGFFITGTGTGVGKTVASAILAEALGAGYWKPVQAGTTGGTDTMTVQQLAPSVQVYPEAVLLRKPTAPEIAAHAEGRVIRPEDFVLPQTDNNLIVEGVGGVLVPLSPGYFVTDLILQLKLPAILVSSLYLGCINHTLLSVHELRRRIIPLAGIVFNGDPDPDTENLILESAAVEKIGHIHREPEMNREVVKRYAKVFSEKMHRLFGSIVPGR